MKFLAIFGLLLVSAVGAGLPLAAETPAIWIDVPFVPQVKDGCGSASISMVLQYWAKKGGQASPDFADAEKIQAALFSPDGGRHCRQPHGVLFSEIRISHFRLSGRVE